MNSNKESTGAKPFFPLTQTPVASPTPIYAMTFQKSHLTELLRHFDKPFFPWGKKFKKKKKINFGRRNYHKNVFMDTTFICKILQAQREFLVKSQS